MQPKKMNRDLSVIWGHDPALAPMTMQERIHLPPKEIKAEVIATETAHAAAIAARDSFGDDTMTNEQRDEPILATAFTAKSLLHPTPQQSAAIARWAAANNLQESMI